MAFEWRKNRELSLFQRVARAWRNASASALFVGSFAFLIVIGTAGLLLLPGLTTGPRIGFLDALFTITSAVCVTGLSVVDPATFFTFAGQVWLLIFIQLGGLGLVTLTTLIIGVLGRRLSLRSEMIAAPPVEITHRSDLRGLTIAAAKFTFGIEALGAFGLWLSFLPHFSPLQAAWHAVFHAVSAFCNAGFSTFSTSLVGYADRPPVLLFTSALIVVGGFGYLSTEELLRWWRSGGKGRARRLSTHTFAALAVTAALLVGGTVLYAVFEWNGALRDLGLIDKLVNAWFLSVTPRTAGFVSVPYSQIGNDTAYLTILLMVVGGSPGSTAGGIKTTAMAVLLALGISRMRGRRHVELHDRTVPDGTVERTVSLALIAFAVMTAGVFWLSFTETRGASVEQARILFLPVFFEVVSAFNTVGLTMDLTPSLTALGKLSIIGLMFVGRVGPLAFFAAISVRGSAELRAVRPAREDLIIG